KDMPAHTRKALDKKPDIDIVLMLGEGQSLQDIASVLGFSTEKGVVQMKYESEGIQVSWELRGNDNYTHAYLTVSDKKTGQFILFDLFAIPHGRGPFDANNRFGRGATYKDIRCIGEITFDEKTGEARVNFNRDFYTYMNMPCMTLNTKGEGMDINQYVASFMHTLAERICWRRKGNPLQLSLLDVYQKAAQKKIRFEKERGSKITGWQDQIQRDALRIAILVSLENPAAVMEYLGILNETHVIDYMGNLKREINLLMTGFKIDVAVKSLLAGVCPTEDALWLLSLFDTV
ncbi:MAG: hypothetical protein AAB893_03500, partial [Patescibacteria group bacterium]